ncbi:hypothetical protein GP2143_15116 [marine gamma proteobacterium HTCC2143]|jgi:hypothetical protein|uniref:DUF465 domain-containing protein n=1 Tax=marine gamma proteobacterium HTCC2143 TaxID=247633 RepID=A0Y8Z3_9GAMM|nr:hypothetical protein GP2143_15116 [marine gamma proteobacterium HTCC2143]|tara:strand:- start:198 stop:404 length:207 start_codon:yes stop_codon:yes gene_type:complete
MENTDIPSLSFQLFQLQTEHRMLDTEISNLQQLPYLDQLKLQRMKRQKLRLKQNIEHIKAQLIPDLNA